MLPKYLYHPARSALTPFLYLAYHFINEAYEGSLSERNNGPSIVTLSLMSENFTRSPNCVLMLLKLAILFSIKSVNLASVFRANCKSPPL